jgi:uncharacterized protein (DUF362 family)
MAHRRAILLGGACLAVAGALRCKRTLAAPARVRVGIARDPGAVGPDGVLVPAGVDHVLDRALSATFGTKDAVTGLSRLLSRGDVVGIKVNCLGGRGISTHPELVEALIGKLTKAGARADDIVVWDRTDRDLARARFTVRRTGTGPLYYGTNDDYENEPIEAGSVSGCLSRILTRKLSVVINVPVLKDHDLAGISGALKSFYGAIHNPNKLHDGGCNPYVADLFQHASVRSKVKLTVFDALVPQFHGGPAYVPANTWKLGGVFASMDPVAADATALKMIEEKRKEAGMDSLEKAGRAPKWLARAAALGLGTTDPTRIEEVVR